MLGDNFLSRTECKEIKKIISHIPAIRSLEKKIPKPFSLLFRKGRRFLLPLGIKICKHHAVLCNREENDKTRGKHIDSRTLARPRPEEGCRSSSRCKGAAGAHAEPRG